MIDVASQFREYVRLDRQRRGDGLSPRELHRFTVLKRRLSQHFSPGLTDSLADERDSVRVPTSLAVSFSSDGELARSLMTNLSRAGVFVRTEHRLEIGTRLNLRIHVDNPPHEVEVPAEVVSHDVGPRFSAEFAGMGMRFLDMQPDVEKQIADLYERVVR